MPTMAIHRLIPEDIRYLYRNANEQMPYDTGYIQFVSISRSYLTEYILLSCLRCIPCMMPLMHY